MCVRLLLADTYTHMLITLLLDELSGGRWRPSKFIIGYPIRPAMANRAFCPRERWEEEEEEKEEKGRRGDA